MKEKDDSSSNPSTSEAKPRRSKRSNAPKDYEPDFMTYIAEVEPQIYKEAMSSPKASLWKEAINSEVESIMQDNTWKLVDLSPENKLIGYKWIFKKKLKHDGTIDKYKACLVAKAYLSKDGLDYFDAYAPVSTINSIRMLIVIVAVYDMEI